MYGDMRTSTAPAGQFAATCAASCDGIGVDGGAIAAAAASATAAPPPRPPLPRTPPTGMPCTASSSAVPVRADSISIGAFLEVVAGHGPAVAPEKRTNVQHADAAAIEVGLVVAGELLHAVAEVEQAEMPRTDVTAARAEEQLAASLQHVDAHVVEKGPGHFPAPGPCGCCS